MTTEQKPIHSGFGSKTTARDALAGIDLGGKIAMVTGGYSGIGVETTRALSEAGATVVVPVRTPSKAEANLAGIAGVELAPLDLLDPASIDRFAAGFLASGRPLHMLINSAGVMASPLTRDSRGYEVQFSANHLGHFQLTARLWPALASLAVALGIFLAASWAGLWLVLPPMGRAIALFVLIVLIAVAAVPLFRFRLPSTFDGYDQAASTQLAHYLRRSRGLSRLACSRPGLRKRRWRSSCRSPTGGRG